MQDTHAIYFGKRESGIPLIGALPWGSHFCQFYQSREDLLEILVPYVQAGLQNNEFCLWVMDDPLSVEEASRALKQAVPRFEKYVQQGQVEILSGDQWRTAAVVSKLDKAISGGFDGLRLVCHAPPQEASGPSVRDTADALCQYNVIAAFTYPRDQFDALGLMTVVKNHRLALVKNAGRWEVIESSEAQSAKEALRRSEEKLHSVFANMSEGYAYHRIVLDRWGDPCDYVFLEVNDAFERLTGLKREDLIGRRVTQAFPGIEKDPADWIGTYGRVALREEPVQFESYSQALRKWYSVSAFSPHKGFFAVTFSDITDRKATERAMQEANQRLQNQAEELQTQAEELHAQTEELNAQAAQLRAVNDELQRSEQALRISEQRVRLKLDSILSPEGDLNNLELADIVDAEAIQSLMDDFYRLAHVPMAVIDLKGRVLVGVGWQTICTKFHRVHPETCRYCIESDTQLTVGVAPGECRLYKCKNHMWDVATPLMVADHHIGNLFSGQFFFDDEPLERELFRAQAQRYGFDEQEYLAALEAVPRLSRETLDTGMVFLTKLARMISQLSYGNIQLARSLGERDRLMESLRQGRGQLLKLNRTLKALSKSNQALMRATEESAYLQDVCKIIVEDCGHAMVWIGYAEQDEAKSVRPVAHAGFEEGYLETLQITWADTDRGRGPTGTAIRTGQPCLCRNMLTDPAFAPWREQAVRRGYASSIVLPLFSDGKAFGAITIYAREPDSFSQDEVNLLMELAADLAYGITSLRLRVAHAQMEQQLRRWNDELEEEVQAQTEELKDTVDRLQEEVGRRTLVEETLRKRSQMLEAFFQHTITPLAFMDRDFNFVRVNAAFAQADGKEPEYFTGRNYFALYFHEENRRIFEQVLQTKQPYFALAKPFIYPDAPHRTRYWNWLLTPLLDEQGDVQFLVLNLEDVTERQKAFQELEHRARQLQKLTLELSQAEDRERKRLAEILHDDLQQQLAAAKFHLSLLGHRLPQEKGVQGAVGQLDQILKDAIEKSRSLSHELSPALLYQSDLGETFEWLARQLKTKHGLTVDVESRGRIDPSSEALKVFLFKTAQEILFNVVKHARVRAARLRIQRLRGGLWLTISDQGQGFDPRSLGKAGGLGLLGIRERIELLGGRMKIRSAPGHGSTFLIVVPDGPKPDDRRRTTDDGQPRMPLSSVVRPPSSVLRVLLVDDHKVMREGLAALLSEQGDLEVVGQAGNGREAVDLACRLGPDVVVMDVAMPLMAGDEATRQIKLQLPRARVVALSMFEEADMAEAMRQAGAEAYLLKTGPSDELLAAIRGRPGP